MSNFVQIFKFIATRKSPEKNLEVLIADIKIGFDSLAKRAGFQVETNPAGTRGATFRMSSGAIVGLEDMGKSHPISVRAAPHDIIKNGSSAVIAEIKQALGITDREISWTPDPVQAHSDAQMFAAGKTPAGNPVP